MDFVPDQAPPKKGGAAKNRVPIVVSMLYCHSKDNKPYPYSLDFFDLFDDKELAKKTYTAEPILVDISRYSTEEIKKEKSPSLFFFTHKKMRGDNFSLKNLDEFVSFFLSGMAKSFYLTEEECLEYAGSILNYVIDGLEGVFLDLLIQKLEKNDFIKKEKIMTTISESLIKKGEISGIQKGMQQGIQKGMQHGMQQGIQKGIQQGIQKGIQHGMQKGEINGIKKVIKQMLSKGLAIAEISAYTSFSVQEIEEIQAEKH
jgi:predicted transposase/invertase (TIGR01784 family)